MPDRVRYRFLGRAGDQYIWWRRIAGDSRVEEIRCGVDWFWARPEPAKTREGQ